MSERDNKEQKSEMLKATSKTYFFDIKETKEKKPYFFGFP